MGVRGAVLQPAALFVTAGDNPAEPVPAEDRHYEVALLFT